MTPEKWEAAKNAGINLANCYHFGDDTNNSICGAMAIWHMPMPGGIPDMPLCEKHRTQYDMLDTEEILDIIVNFLLEKDEDENDA